IVATGHYADKTEIDLTDKVTWSSDNPKVADVKERWIIAGVYKGGGDIHERQGKQVALVSEGKATITAVYEGSGSKHEAKAKVTATAPKFAINAAAPYVATYVGPGKFLAEVGKTQRLAVQVYAGDRQWSDVPLGNIKWEVKPAGAISIDRAGNAT